MKKVNTKISLNPFVKKQIKELNDDAKRSKRRFRGIAITLSVINLAMIAIASAAIELLVEYHKSSRASSSKTGVILTSSAAALVVIMFILQFTIAIVRTKRKQGIYKDALDEIQLEVIKHSERIDDYSKKSKDKILEERCNEIKEKALRSNNKRRVSSLVLRGLVGGDDA